MPVHSISFSIHASKIVPDVPPKTRLLAYIDPNHISTYIYDNEMDYYQDYRSSYFAVTKKKAGWDCMRHYEILANGCIPLFEGLEDCPERTMTHFPKELILETNQLFLEILAANGGGNVENLNPEHRRRCDDAVRALLEYTRKRLTNESMVQYMLQVMGIPEPQRVIFLFESPQPDYLKEHLLTGCKDRWGTACHDYPRTDYVYQSTNPLDPQLYGRGISYTRLLDPALRDEELDRTLVADIQRRTYDLVVYGSWHRGLPFWDIVSQHYAAHEVVMVCGEDLHSCNYAHLSEKGHHVFVRELS